MFGRKSVYGKHVNNTTAQPEKKRKATRFNIRKPGYKTRQPQKTGKSIDNFEQEYQKFIADLKAKKEAEAKVEEPVETKVEEPVVEETPVVEDNIQTLLPEQPVEEPVTEETVVYVPKKRKRIVNENIQENTEEN